jgi:hypothetical protein
MPFFLQSASSSSRMGRDAPVMSISPLANFLKPPPVPDLPTVGCTFGCAFANSSATASEIGSTVLEPSMRIVPESVDCVLVAPFPEDGFPHAAKNNTAAHATIAHSSRGFMAFKACPPKC